MRLTLLQEVMLPDLIKRAARAASEWSTKAGLRRKEKSEDRANEWANLSESEVMAKFWAQQAQKYQGRSTDAPAKPTTRTNANT